jgi:hypothetical protein
LKGKKIFSLVHLKFPNNGEVPILDKCHCNIECLENLNFSTLEDGNLLLATARYDCYFKGISGAANRN